LNPPALKPPPLRVPRRLRSTGDLRALQRTMAHALFRPLDSNDGLQRTWIDGRPMEDVAAEFIKPNDRLSSFERLQLYNRMYWFRLFDAISDDCPGLRALLGDDRFFALARAYLARHPSRSFTLRNLCSRLPQFIAEEPRWSAPRTGLALAVARFEWAQTEAFDGEGRPKLTADDIADAPPSRLRLGLQPYLSLLRLEYPVDDYVIAVKRRSALRGEASNAPVAGVPSARLRRVKPPGRGRIHLAVHRYEDKLYYKRLERPAFLILQAIRDGATVARATLAGGRGLRPEQVSAWFSTWAQLGWLCRRSVSR
jgi:hypothetical protein